MATYSEIKGNNIPIRSVDPTNPLVGEIWYNTTTRVLKGLISQSAAWSTGPNTSRTFNSGSGLGNYDGAVIFQGASGSPAPNPVSNQTEEYTGSAWTSAPSYPFSGRDGAGTGVATSGLGICGHGPSGPSTTCNEWTGSSWTGIPANPTPLRSNTAIGIETAALNFGGGEGAGETTVGKTQEYDGSSWSDSNAMNTGRKNAGGTGTQTAAIAAGGGGYPGVPEPTQGALAEEYNGTCWSNSNNVVNPRNSEAGMTGVQTDSILYGGSSPPGPITATEAYNGTCFSNISGATIPNPGGGYIQGNGSTSPLSPAYHVRGGPNGTATFTAPGPATVTITSS